MAPARGVRRLRKAVLTRRFFPNPDPENVSFTLDEDQPSRPLSSEDEKRWQTERLTANVRMGAKFMILVDLANLGALFYTHSGSNDHRSLACYFRGDKTHEFGFLFIEFGFPMVALPIFYSCIHSMRKKLYTFTVTLFFFYFIFTGLPPPENDGGVCSLYQTSSLTEHSIVHLLMAWILLTPTVLPSSRMLHLTWLYIGVGYVGASLYAHFYMLDGADHPEQWLFRMIGCTLLLLAVNIAAINKKYYLEKGQLSKFVMDVKHKESTRRMFNILEYMVPVHLIAPMLKNPGKVIAEQVECASILFIMFVDFDQTASRLEPHELLDFLNYHFTLFDGICARHGVTKIETVGEEYVCAVGVVPADVERSSTQGHQAILGRLITVASEILQVAEEDKQVVLKMGIHTGPVVAGVIGHKLPRFRLFGDTINTAARMMQKGLPGELQFGEETQVCLPQGVEVELRGQIEMKGKGQVVTYLLRREKTSKAVPETVPQPGEAKVAPEATPKLGPKVVCFASDVELRSSSFSRCSKASFARSEASARSSKTSRGSRKSIAEVLMQHMQSCISAASPSAHSTSSSSTLGAGWQEPELVTRSVKGIEPGRDSFEVELTDLNLRDGAGRAQRAATNPLLDEASTATSSTAAPSCADLHVTWGSVDHCEVRTDVSMNTLRTEQSEAFEQAVQEVCAAAMHDGDQEAAESGGSTGLERARRWLLSLGPGWNSFPKEMEEAFCNWYHESAIVKKLDKRLESQLLMVSVMTTYELMWSVFVTHVFEEAEDQSTSLRLPIFLASRVVVSVVVAGWRAACDHEWIRKAPQDVQLRILISYALIALLLCISYDKLSYEPDPFTEDTGVMKTTFFYELIFVPVYFIVTTLHPLLFVPSCTFTVEAALLMFLRPFLLRNLQFELSSMMVFVGNSMWNTWLAHSREENLRARFRANASISLAQDRIEHILNTLMPVQVVEEIRDNELNAPPRAHTYRCATVAQSDLCGFTKLASTRRPEEVVEFIGELFGAFDELTDVYEIYKVETVGDAYIAGQADFPLTYKNSPMSVVLFGLDMVRATHEWSRKRGENVSCRVGVHTGECVGGIVGSEMQRYHLFGRLMTGLEVLESTAPEGRVQVSIACKEAVEHQLREEGREVRMFEPRQEARLTTSKGEIHEFEEVGGPTFVVKSFAQIRGQLTV